MTWEMRSATTTGLLRSIIEGVPIRVFWKDRECRYLGCNTLFARDAGVTTPADLIGKTDYDLGWRDQAESYRADDRAVMESGAAKVDFEEPQSSPGGDLLWLRTSKVPLRDERGEVIGVLGIYEDITARKRMEEAYRESEGRFRHLFETSPDPCWIINAENRFYLCNQAAAHVLGYDAPEEVIARHPSEHSPEYQPDGATSLAKANEMMATAHAKGLHRFEWIHRRRNGEEFPVEVTLAAIEVAGERQLYCIWRDISARKEFESSLLETRARHEEAQRIARLGHWELDPETGGFVWSDEVYRIFGVAPGAFTPSAGNLLERCHPDDRRALADAYLASVRHGAPYDIVHRILTPDGSVRWVNVRGETTFAPDGHAVRTAGTVLDITERQLAQEERANLQTQLDDAQRLESVGRLAGGVAHDFNNMLSMILGGAEMALLELPAGHPAHQYLKDVQDAARRSAELTRQLLAFASRQTTVPRVLNLNGTVADTLRMLWRIIGENIEVRWTPADDLWPVRIDPSQVDQILANLCVNARDAIATVGRIDIATANRPVSAMEAARHGGAAPGDHVVLRLSDNGSGMAPEVLEHIFEPFFTTKGVGEGTGLGLATVYGIVRQNGGFIVVNSKLGEGTTFELFLPAYRGAVDPSPEPAPAATTSAGGETILLVEDEAAVRRMTKGMLIRLGYRVIDAGSGVDALELLEAHLGEIDLLVTDVIMPGMNGRDLAQAVRRRRAGLPTLFVSGYPSDAVSLGAELDERTLFTAKPFTLAELGPKLRQVLEGRGAGRG